MPQPVAGSATSYVISLLAIGYVTSDKCRPGVGRRFKTLVLIPVIAVLATLVASLPITQSQSSANAPQNVVSLVGQDRSIEIAKLATYEKESKKQKTRSNEKASRSKRANSLAAKTNQAFAKSYMESEYSWGENQHSCLVDLWNRESGWRHTADNPTSSAYGIPQALPGKKMASAGADWKTNPETQIKWGLKYIQKRYDTPCGAWSAFKQKGWY